MNKSYKSLEKTIKYKFNNPENINEALIHKSINQEASKNNQRLEFLGDSILGSIISKYLYNKFPFYTDGELTRLKSSLVKKEALADLGKKLLISKYLVRQKNMDLTTSMLEDTIEAIIGAIFIDSDFNTTEKVVIQLFETHFIDKINSKSFLKQKSSSTARLKEYSERKYQSYPEVIFVKKEGKDNRPTFTMIVKVNDFMQKGTGQSKKEAIANASQKLLDKIKD